MANGFEVSSEYQPNAHSHWGAVQAPSSLVNSPPTYLQYISNAMPGLQQSVWAASQLHDTSSHNNSMWTDVSTGGSSQHWKDERVYSHKQASSIPLGISPQQNGLGDSATADLLAAMLQVHSFSHLPYGQTGSATASHSSPRNIPEHHHTNTGRWPGQESGAPSGISSGAAGAGHALSMLAALANAQSQQLSHPMTAAPLALPLTSMPTTTSGMLLGPSMASPSWFTPLSSSNALVGMPAASAELSLQHHLANGMRLPSSTSAMAASMLCNGGSRADSGNSAVSTASSDTMLESAYGSSPTSSSAASGSPSTTPAALPPHHLASFHHGLFQQHHMPGVNVARSDVSDASTDTLKGGSGGEEEFSDEEVAAAAWERSRTLAVLGIKYDGVVSAELRRSVGAPFQHMKGFVGVYMPAMSLRSCKTNRRSRSFAFIKFSTPDAAVAALETILTHTCPNGTVPIVLPGAGRQAVRCQVERVQEKSTADLVQKYRSFVKSCQRLGLYHLLS